MFFTEEKLKTFLRHDSRFICEVTRNSCAKKIGGHIYIYIYCFAVGTTFATYTKYMHYLVIVFSFIQSYTFLCECSLAIKIIKFTTCLITG